VAGSETVKAMPKYAVLENERRFLVDPAKMPIVESLPYWRILDRYVEGTRLRLRCVTDSATGAQVFKFCKKYPSDDPVSGAIVNIYLTAREHGELSLLPARVITKRRYHVQHSGLVFGLNVFEGDLAGLVLCEAEAETRDASLAMAFPPWVGREVTEDLAFTGGELSRMRPEDIQAVLSG
jgi:CYTH domain-containing protein